MPIIHGTVTHSRKIKRTGLTIYYCVDHAPRSATRLPEGSTYGLHCTRCYRVQMQLVKQHRNGACAGCRNNRYNFATAGDGWNAATEGDGCWHLGSIKAGVCSSKHS
jgi:hypothetical protein